ncbi:MAG: cAMP phosphodiesterase [Synechococcaceae cyanobacterium]|nr:cAMP phosphodiesterase [Synechococcaceae cyanobacterium]
MTAPSRSAAQPRARPAAPLPVLLAVVLAAGACPPAQALPDAPPPPAGEAEITLYGGIAGLTVCVARSAGVGFEQAVAIAGETIAQLIQSQHGSVISLVSDQPLSPDDLRKGAINSALLGAVEACPEQVPDAVRTAVQASLREARSAAPRGGS